MRRALRQALALALLPAVPAVVAGFFHPKRPEFSDAPKVGELAAGVAVRDAGRYYWIDARSSRDYDEGHIPGAVLLNEDDWNGLLPAVIREWPAGKPAVVYCSTRQCQASRDVARRLREFSVTPVLELKGGWEAWLALQKK